MYRRKEILHNVTSYLLNENDTLIISGKDNSYQYNYVSKEKKILISSEMFYMILLQDNILLFQIENGKSFFSYNEEEIMEYKGCYYLWKLVKYSEGFLVKGKYENKKCIYKFDKEFNNSIIECVYYPEKFIDNTHRYLFHGGTYISLNLFENDIQLWQHSFSELLQGNDILQTGNILLSKNKLYFHLYERNQTNNATVCLDVESGTVLNKYNNFGIYLQEQDDSIYTAYNYEFKILDTKTQKVESVNMENDFEQHNLRINLSRWVVHDNLLYFVDGMIMPTNRFGIIDIDTGKLIDLQEIDINDGISNNIKEIQVRQDKIYIHASDNTLHIFEKE